MENLEVFHKYLKPTLKKLCEKDPENWDMHINQILASYRVMPNLTTALTHHFFSSIVKIQTYHCTNFWNQCNDS